MSRLFYLTLVSLVLAGIVHLLIILLIPSYATKDAWTRLAERSGIWSFTPVASPDLPVSVLPLVDPAFRMSACRFDLSEAPLRLASDGFAPFWSVAIFDRQGRNIYSFNDRTAIERRLSALVVNPVQMARLRKNPPPDAESAVLVETESSEGFVVVRVLQSDPSWTEETSSFLRSAVCERYVLPTDQSSAVDGNTEEGAEESGSGSLPQGDGPADVKPSS
ncbi:MAG: DUF1254 domain-containing protein [Pseudomonadota bacterium]